MKVQIMFLDKDCGRREGRTYATIDWPDGLSLPPIGADVALWNADWWIQVRNVRYSPLDEIKAQIVFYVDDASLIGLPGEDADGSDPYYTGDASEDEKEDEQ